jgi:ADP-heptose:LPS heptosyltransferase
VAFLKRIELKLKRIAFFPLSIFLRDGDKLRAAPRQNQVKRVLLLRPETKIGDMVISLPTIRHLHAIWPNAELYIFCSPRNTSVIQGDSALTGIFHYEKNIIRDFFHVRKVRRLHCDVVIDLLYHDSLTTLILSQWSAPTAYRIGGGKKRFARYYDWAGPWAHAHIIDVTLSLLEPLGIDITTAKRQIPIAVDSQATLRAQHEVRELRQSCSCLFGLNVSAGTATRTWDADKIAAFTADILTKDANLGIVLLGTPKDRQRFKFLSEGTSGRVLAPNNGNSIQDASAMIAELDFIVSPDTAMVHIARSLDKPVVGLYTGNVSNRLKFQPWGDGNIAVIARHYDNIHDITVDEVTSAVTEMIQRVSSKNVSAS